MLIGPDAAFQGTVVEIDVVPVTVFIDCALRLNLSRLFAAVGSKFVPVMVTPAPGTPMPGVTFVMLRIEATTNRDAELADAVGVVTVIAPVVAPAGTVAMI